MRARTRAAAKSLNAYFNEMADLCRIRKPMTFHTARHTFVTVRLLHGLPTESVSKMLGHTILKIMQH